jgi:hypothetical protein
MAGRANNYGQTCTFSKEQIDFALGMLAKAIVDGDPECIAAAEDDARVVGASEAMIALIRGLPAVEVVPNGTSAMIRAATKPALETAWEQLEAVGFARTRVSYATQGGFQSRVNYGPGHGLEQLHAALGKV